MEDQSKFYKYIAWKTPEEMHFSCLQWISYLDFIREEQFFLADLLKQYILPVIEAHLFEKASELVEKLSVFDKEEKKLTTKLISHRNLLNIMIDGIDQLKKEQEYTAEHANLKIEVSQYTKNHRILKKEIFKIVSSALKKQKENRLPS